MPRGRKKKSTSSIKKKNIKTKPIQEKVSPKSTDVSKEVRDIFFNTSIEDNDYEEDLTAETEDVVKDDIEDVELNRNVLEDEEVVKATKEKDTIADTSGGEDIEQVIVTTFYSEDGEEIHSVQTFRKNAPPKETWADKFAKFKSGQRIMPKSLKPTDYSSYECATVISAGSEYDTYQIKLSRAMNETQAKGKDWVLADKSCKPYVSYWEANSPIIKVNKRV